MILPPAPPWDRPGILSRVGNWATIASPIARWVLYLVGIVCIIGWLGFATQSIRLEGLQLRLPLIGTIGPQGWKPYAEQLEGDVIRVSLQRDEANSNHRQTKRNYRSAQETAARLQEAENERKEAEHRRNLNDVRNRLTAERNAFRDRFERMRDSYVRERTFAGGETGEVRVPLDRDTGGAVEEAGCYGISGRRPYLVQIKCDQIASEQAAQLIALQDAVRRAPGVVITHDASERSVPIDAAGAEIDEGGSGQDRITRGSE